MILLWLRLALPGGGAESAPMAPGPAPRVVQADLSANRALLPVGGHHVPAKAAFRGDAAYDMNKALAIPNADLASLGVSHTYITKSQMKGYKAFAATGETLTWDAVSKIETDALVAGGMSLDMAAATVQKGIGALQDAGVQGPTRIPWGGQ